MLRFYLRDRDRVRNEAERLDSQKEWRQLLNSGPPLVPDDLDDLRLDEHIKPDSDCR